MAFVSSWRWYGVRVLSQTVIDGGEPSADSATALYTESVCIVKAQSHEQACKIAERRVKAKKIHYVNIYGQKVTQKFVSILDCYYFEQEPEPGTTVYTCQYQLPADIDPADSLTHRLHPHH